jgi:hypothetical protein
MEILLVVFLVGIIGMAISSFQLDVSRTNTVITGSLASQDEARRALRHIIAEVRTASPSNLGAYPISSVGTSSITFFTDSDGDLLKEQIRYFMSGTTLRRGSIKPSGSPLAYNSANEQFSDAAHNIRNATSSPIFYYYDTNYDGTTPPLSYPIDVSTIRLIKVSLFIDDDMLRAPDSIEVTTQISMRNLKDNL